MKTIALPIKWFRILLAVSFGIGGIQCAQRSTSGASPSTISKLELKVETNPNPNAIVGMWHLREVDSISKSTSSLFFSKNGRMLQTTRVDVKMFGMEMAKEVPVHPAKYGYDGDGWWSIRGIERSFRFRLAEGKLLNYTVRKNGKNHVNVYVRVP
jgi:hypothetical protein